MFIFLNLYFLQLQQIILLNFYDLINYFNNFSVLCTHYIAKHSLYILFFIYIKAKPKFIN